MTDWKYAKFVWDEREEEQNMFRRGLFSMAYWKRIYDLRINWDKMAELQREWKKVAGPVQLVREKVKKGIVSPGCPEEVKAYQNYANAMNKYNYGE